MCIGARLIYCASHNSKSHQALEGGRGQVGSDGSAARLAHRSRVAAEIDWVKRGTLIDKGFPFMRPGYPKMLFWGSDVNPNSSFSAIR